MKNFFKGLLKLVVAAVILVVVFAAGFSLNEFSFNGKQFESPVVLTKTQLLEVLDKELSPEIIELSQRVADTTRTQGAIMESVVRCHHYLSGHDSKFPLDFCPECGLTSALDKRLIAIDMETTTIADQIKDLEKNSPEHQEGAKKQVALQAERNMIHTYLFNRSEMETKIGQMLKATKFNENGAVEFKLPEEYTKNLQKQFDGKNTNILQHAVSPARTPEEGAMLRRINAMNHHAEGK